MYTRLLSLARASPSAKVEEVGRDPHAWWKDVRATSSGYGLWGEKNLTILQTHVRVLHSALHSYTLICKMQQSKIYGRKLGQMKTKMY